MTKSVIVSEFRKHTTNVICHACQASIDHDLARRLPYPSDCVVEGEPTTILFCSHCGLGMAFPLPSDESLKKYYERGGYWQHEKISIIKRKNYPVASALAESRWAAIQNVISHETKSAGIDLLDIGAGHGFFGLTCAASPVVKLKSYTAIESDHVVTKSLQQTWSHKYKNIPLAIECSLDRVSRSFDLIVFSHILEHVTNPKDFLKQAINKLNKRGIVFIEVPNQDYLFKRKVYPHLSFFNQNSLGRLLSACSLKTHSIEVWGRDMKKSPLNFRNEKSVCSFIEEGFRRARRVIPYAVSKRFYSWYYGIFQKSEQGTWLRAIARNG